jgi:hypothetical protein
MPTRIDWLPYGIEERKAFIRYFAATIQDVAGDLGLLQAEVDRIQEISEAYSFAVDVVEQSKTNMKALVSWRDHVISNKRSFKPVPQRPIFDNSPAPAGTTASLIAEFRKIVRRVKSSSGYEPTLGVRLNILPPNHVKTPLRELKPVIKVKAVEGFRVRFTCERKGMTAFRVEWRPKGAEKWQVVAFLTKLPETFYIEPAVPGVPETGQIRAWFIKDNKTVGDPSNSAIVTIFGL